MTSDLMEFIKTQWADIHHSRNQEWTIIGLIGISLYLFSQATDLASQITAIGIGIATCVVGIVISIKHWALLFAKARMINICQEELGIKIKYFRSPLFLRVQGMIIVLYFLIISALFGLLTWLLFSNIKITIVAVIVVIIHGIAVQFLSYSWVIKKREEIEVTLSPELLRSLHADSKTE